MDYIYNFDKKLTKRIHITIKKGMIHWPVNVSTSNHTVLLQLKLKHKLLRNNSYPSICTVYKEHKTQHSFERKNEGIKLLNLTNITSNIRTNETIKLKSNNLTWEDNGELIILQNNISRDDKAMIIAPHPDDAEIAAFRFYSSHKSHIVTITAGEGRDNTQSSLLKGKIRVIDSITTPLIGGVQPQQAINLGYFNNSLLEMYKNPHAPYTSTFTNLSNINYFRKHNVSTLLEDHPGDPTWENLVKDLRLLLLKTEPSLIVLPHPRLDKNQDHKLSTLALLQALKQTNISSGKFLFYIVHSSYSHRYPYGAQGTPITLPPTKYSSTINYGIYSQQLTAAQQIEKMYALNTMHDLREEPNHLCSIKKVMLQKVRRALGRYNKRTPWYNNYRKSVRSNELFLTTPFSSLDAIMDEYNDS